MDNRDLEKKPTIHPDLQPDFEPEIPQSHHLPHWVSISAIILLGLIIIGVVSYAAYQYFFLRPALPVGPGLIKPIAEWSVYQNEHPVKFELKYPPAWQAETEQIDGINKLIFKDVNLGNPDNDYLVFSIDFLSNQKKLSLAKWWAETNQDSSYRKTDEIDVAGSTALKLEPTDKKEESRYLLLSPKSDWIVDISAFGLQEEIINQILSTFKFVD